MSEILSPKYYRFLQQHLSKWQQDALISAEQESAILSRYQLGNTQLWQILLYALAATLLGGGIILLLAHNWAQLSRPIRAAISYFPLLLSYIGLFAFYRKPSLQAAREGIGIFHALALISALALIGQTYHSGGDVYELLANSAWLLLPIALLYPAQSPVCALIVFVAAGLFNATFGDNAQAIALLCLPLLFCYRLKNSMVLQWFLAIYILLLLMRWCLEWDEDLIMQSAYLLLPLYYILGRGLFAPNYAHNPLAAIGAIGIIGMIIIVSWGGVNSFFYLANISLSKFCIVCIFLLAYFLYRKKLRWHQAAFAFALVLTSFSIMMFASKLSIERIDNLLLLYFFFLGIALCIVAEREQRWAKFNASLLIVCNVVAAVFFDSDASFVARGIAFIGIGLLLLVANIWMMKKRRAQ